MLGVVAIGETYLYLLIVGCGETRRLWKHIEPYFRTVMSRIYLRESSLSDRDGIAASSLTELPYHSKYLLLASFLASYNPSRVDRRFFSKVRSSIMKILLCINSFSYQLKQPKLHKPRGQKAMAEVN